MKLTIELEPETAKGIQYLADLTGIAPEVIARKELRYCANYPPGGDAHCDIDEEIFYLLGDEMEERAARTNPQP